MSDIYHQWLLRDPDPITRNQLRDWIETKNTTQLEQSFNSRLSFGTAGIRGPVGCGPARFNQLLVQETTAGVGHYLLHCFSAQKQIKVVVGFDARPHSHQFAMATAATLTALGLYVYLAQTPTPTPLCAFAVRHLNAQAGIVITASHNPPEDNGYKVFNHFGSQIAPPEDTRILQYVEQAITQALPNMPEQQARHLQLLCDWPVDVIEHYCTGILKASYCPGHQYLNNLCVAYTPLHGVGAQLTQKVMLQMGCSNFHSVPEQTTPDGHFPTIASPNPEQPDAMTAVIALAHKHQAHLACAHDPDADRLAVAVRTPQGQYQRLSGDQIGVLLADYLIQTSNQKICFITTLVSSSMLERMAKAHQIEFRQTLTGFKWIAQQMREAHQLGYQDIFAYEQALGYCYGDLVYDKDGISALVAFLRMTAHHHKNNQNLFCHLEQLYRTYGLHLTHQISLPCLGNAHEWMQQLRQHSPTHIDCFKVISIADLLHLPKLRASGNISRFPSSDTLIYYLSNNTRIIIRPSGTEPILKCYYELCVTLDTTQSFEQQNKLAKRTMLHLCHHHQQYLQCIVQSIDSIPPHRVIPGHTQNEKK